MYIAERVMVNSLVSFNFSSRVTALLVISCLSEKGFLVFEIQNCETLSEIVMFMMVFHQDCLFEWCDKLRKGLFSWYSRRGSIFCFQVRSHLKLLEE